MCICSFTIIVSLFEDRNDQATRERLNQMTPIAERDNREWRRLPMSGRECIIIVSNEDKVSPFVDAVPKQRPTSSNADITDFQLLRSELDQVQEKLKQVESIRTVKVYSPADTEVQMNQEYFLNEIKHLMVNCKEPGGEKLLYVLLASCNQRCCIGCISIDSKVTI